MKDKLYIVDGDDHTHEVGYAYGYAAAHGAVKLLLTEGYDHLTILTTADEVVESARNTSRGVSWVSGARARAYIRDGR